MPCLNSAIFGSRKLKSGRFSLDAAAFLSEKQMELAVTESIFRRMQEELALSAEASLGKKLQLAHRHFRCGEIAIDYYTRADSVLLDGVFECILHRVTRLYRRVVVRIVYADRKIMDFLIEVDVTSKFADLVLGLAEEYLEIHQLQTRPVPSNLACGELRHSFRLRSRTPVTHLPRWCGYEHGEGNVRNIQAREPSRNKRVHQHSDGRVFLRLVREGRQSHRRPSPYY